MSNEINIIRLDQCGRGSDLPHRGVSEGQDRMSDETVAGVPDEEFNSALSRFDFDGLEPRPLKQSPFGRVARPFYLNMVASLREQIAVADLRQPDDFHGLLWLAVKLGAKQCLIARAEAIDTSVLNRWIQSVHTPDEDRRRGILNSAMRALDDAIDRTEPIPLRSCRGRRAGALDAMDGAVRR